MFAYGLGDLVETRIVAGNVAFALTCFWRVRVDWCVVGVEGGENVCIFTLPSKRPKLLLIIDSFILPMVLQIYDYPKISKYETVMIFTYMILLTQFLLDPD
jgi:hypothetical protein